MVGPLLIDLLIGCVVAYSLYSFGWFIAYLLYCLIACFLCLIRRRCPSSGEADHQISLFFFLIFFCNGINFEYDLYYHKLFGRQRLDLLEKKTCDTGFFIRGVIIIEFWRLGGRDFI